MSNKVLGQEEAFKYHRWVNDPKLNEWNAALEPWPPAHKSLATPSPFLLVRRGHWTSQWKGGASWASRARAQHRLEDHSHPCARKQLLQSGHCQRQRYSLCRRAAILKTEELRAWDRWRRLWRRRLVRTVSARVSPSDLPIFGPRLWCCPYSQGPCIAVPGPVTLSLGSFSLPQPSSLLEPLLTACLEPWSVLNTYLEPQDSIWWTAPLSSRISQVVFRRHTGRAENCKASCGQRLVPCGGRGRIPVSWGPGTAWTLVLCGRRDTQ